MKDLIIDQFASPTQIQREKMILDIMHLVLYAKTPKGRRYSIQAACKEVGIDQSTWTRWVQEGLTNAPMQKLGAELNQVVYDEILPHYRHIVEGIVAMAMGKVPKNSALSEIKAPDMLAAAKFLLTIIPPRALDKLTTGNMSEAEHLESYQPGQVFINVASGDFIYQGNNSFSLKAPKPNDDEEEIIDIE